MQIRIHHLSGSKKGEVQTFQSPSVSLGRKEGNDVIFDTKLDRTVSGKHAEVRFDGGQWIFADLSSTAGSWINGTQIDTIPLTGDEEIELGSGGPCLRFEPEQPERTPRTAAMPEVTPASAPTPQRAIGQKTVGMMIQSAITKSRDNQTGRVARISFVRSVASEAVRHGSRRFKVGVAFLFVVLACAIGFLVWELQQTRAELKALNLSKLGPSEIGEWIAEQNKGSIYLLIYRTRTGFEQGFCTGFAVNQVQLLTNAHCIAQMAKLSAEGAVFFAAPNEGLGARYPVVRWRAHPAYDAAASAPTADIGSVTVNGRFHRVVALASADQISAIKSGSQIFVFGFPGDLSNVGSPVATITNGVIGRMTALNGQAAAPNQRYLLQHSAFTSKGTSGSPVFDKLGRVIAVNSGYYQGKSRVKIEHPITGKAQEANVSRDLSGYAFGIRIDLANEVFK